MMMNPLLNNNNTNNNNNSNEPLRIRDQDQLRVRESFFMFLARYIDLLSSDQLPPQFQNTDNNRHQLQLFVLEAEYYAEQLQRLSRDSQWSTLIVRWGEFVTYDEIVASVVEENFLKFSSVLDEALEQVMDQYFPPTDGMIDRDARRRNGTLPTVAFQQVPRQWTVRSLRASHVGHLCAISGTVTRTSQVRPELRVGVFRCNDCGMESEPVDQQFKFTEPAACRNAQCENKRFWTLCTDARGTVFGDWQKLRVQENANEIPVGCMPRTVEVIVRGDAVESAKPGDRVVAVGCPIVVPEVAKLFNILNRREVQRSMTGGQRAMGEDGAGGGGGGGGAGANAGMDGATGLKILGVRDLNYRLSFLAQIIADSSGDVRRMTERNLGAGGGIDGDRADAGSSHMLGRAETEIVRLTDAEAARITRMRETDNFVQQMARCIAPNVFSHTLVKIGLLLQMIGGVPKRTLEGTSLRGDINVCIVGDPSTAKSHLLKWVSNLVPRGVYTSGKASSASGLTATITRDADTGERTIEAGALMLADHGVCCIDEFDKMDVRDQVAIHEAMEQQTISIAKAGIKATLNARASLLAALNPIGGKYDRRKPLQKNVAITAPIMSRFDLMFCIVDDGDPKSDRDLAQQIVSLHGLRGEEAAAPPFATDDVQLYIKFSRSLQPKLTDEANVKIVTAYRQLRMQDALANRSKVFRVTTRLLESIIRLSEATAKCYLDEYVLPRHVELALELMTASLTTVDMTQVELINEGAGGQQQEEDEENIRAAQRAQQQLQPQQGQRGRGGKNHQQLHTQQQQQQQQQQQPPRASSSPQDDSENVDPASTQHQHRQQQQRKITISADEYNALSRKVLAFVDNTTTSALLSASAAQLQAFDQGSTKQYPPVNDVIRFVLSRSASNDVNVLRREARLVQLIIKKLLHEGKLLDVEDEDNPEIRKLAVHPDHPVGE